jgi:membrane-bound lytic murein transglycosylase D
MVVTCATAGPAGAQTGVLEDLMETGRALFETYAPDDVKAEYEFPDAAAVERFLADVETALDEGSFEQLAAYAGEASVALRWLRMFEGGEDLADWLEPRLEFLEAAPAVGSQEPPSPRARPLRPGETPNARPPVPTVQPPTATGPRSKGHWQSRLAGRAAPARAGQLVPGLQRIFREEGVPPEWVWLAEVESSMNPKARSPAGAVGLFQFMPATAERFGLRISWPDERLDPAKSARAAAQYLHFLHGRFQSWPLALAAYNAGEGRVGRTLQSRSAKSFAEIQSALPAETQLYVPKVLATVEVRTGADGERLPPPRARVSVFRRPGSAAIAVGFASR